MTIIHDPIPPPSIGRAVTFRSFAAMCDYHFGMRNMRRAVHIIKDHYQYHEVMFCGLYLVDGGNWTYTIDVPTCPRCIRTHREYDSP